MAITDCPRVHDALNRVIGFGQIPSPDIADAFALTFAYPVSAQAYENEEDRNYQGRSYVTGY